MIWHIIGAAFAIGAAILAYSVWKAPIMNEQGEIEK